SDSLRRALVRLAEGFFISASLPSAHGSTGDGPQPLASSGHDQGQSPPSCAPPEDEPPWLVVSRVDDPPREDEWGPEYGDHLVFLHAVLGELREISTVPFEVLGLSEQALQPRCYGRVRSQSHNSDSIAILEVPAVRACDPVRGPG